MTFLNKSITISLPRAFITALLSAFYILAFIITPYWTLVPSPTARLAMLAFTIIIGAAWCILSGSDLHIRIEIRSLVFFAILLVAVFAFNYQELMTGLPWRGDESYHFYITQNLANLLTIKWVLRGLAAIVIFLLIAWKKPGWTLPAGGLLLAAVILFFLYRNPFQRVDAYFLLRYPFVSYWFTAILPKVAAFLGNPYIEILYRVIPVLFASALAWVFQRSLAPIETPTYLLWGLSVALMPIVFYYSSILYLELPAVFLMTIVCLRSENLLSDNFAQLKQDPGWYALILIGFIKETTIPFLVCFMVVRWGALLLQYRHSIQLLIHRLADELSIAFSVFFPLFFYLALRSLLIHTRGYDPKINGLFEPRVYIALGQSFIDQFGLFLLLLIVGWIVLLRKRMVRAASFFLLALVGIPFFFTIDTWYFAGYSRFNLYILPLVLAGASFALRWISGWRKWASLAAACITILASLYLSPINIDGTKRPYWDNYITDTAEHYYPYREVLTWLKETHPKDRILFTGFYYGYDFYFYFGSLNWAPNFEVLISKNTQDQDASLSAALARAEKQHDQVIVFHVLGEKIPQAAAMGPFYQEKIFKNMAHQLVVYSSQRANP